MGNPCPNFYRGSENALKAFPAFHSYNYMSKSDNIFSRTYENPPFERLMGGSSVNLVIQL